MRGLTLIELMITVALIGIATVTVGSAVTRQRLDGQEELHRARADQLLAYHADCAIAGTRADEAIASRLMEGLPRAAVKVADKGALREVTVTWGPRDALHRRALVVFASAEKKR